MGKEILLVEDSESDARLLKRALELAGVKNPILNAWNAAQALLYLNANEKAAQKGEQPPMLVVFLDLKLPDQSGFDILKVMQGRKGYSDTLRVVVSQIEDMENIRKAYTLGADAFIVKPPTQDDLAELIRAFPEPWLLADFSQAKAPRNGASSQSADFSQLSARQREIIEKLQANFETLRSRVADDEETFAIIDTLVADFRARHRPVEHEE